MDIAQLLTDPVVNFIYAVVATTVVFLATVIGIIARLWLRIITTKITTCNESLQQSISHIKEASLENRERIEYAHDRITDHVERHHSK